MPQQPGQSMREVIDRSPVSWFQKRTVLLCFLLGLADGFDALAIGYLLPAMAAEWAVPASTFGPAITIGLIGMVVGTTVIAPLADRIGRRTVLLGSTLLYGSATAVIPLVSTVGELAAVRIVAGIGLGAVVPNLVALSAEYMPARARGKAVLVVLCGITIGGFLCGIVAGAAVPTLGWRSVFLIGAVLPVVLVLVCWRLLPDSLGMLVRRGRHDRARALLGRISPEAATVRLDDPAAGPAPARTTRIPVRALFTGGLAPATTLLWITWFATYVIVYFLYSWLPTLLGQVGVDPGVAILAMSLCLLANTVGGLTQGVIIDRRRDYASLTVGLPVAVVVILAVPAVFDQPVLLTVLICLIGFFAVGVNQALSTITAEIYPLDIRATGVGWSFGAGRIGSLIAPLAGGALMAAGVAGGVIFQLIAVPAAIGAVSLALLVVRVHRARRATAPAAAGSTAATSS
ncbi:MFS transporter [Pseudonocardia sp. ICBG601]|uniref:MFS transporter n=1 Tax=Pseudonocardia sp. ICBG601 TaxID=2846759 RepID=UPI001CF6C776|nr:MFS transporter [Pseudonocardia sp. ICBG601]